MISRRGIITGAAALIAAPAIVRVDNLMRIRGVILPGDGISLISTAHPGFMAEVWDGELFPLAYLFRQTKEISAANVINFDLASCRPARSSGRLRITRAKE